MHLKIRGRLRITEIQGGPNRPYTSERERLDWIRAGTAREVVIVRNLITDRGLLALPRLLANCAGSATIGGTGVAQSDCSVAFMDLSRSQDASSGFPSISKSDTGSYAVSPPVTVELVQRPVIVFYPEGESTTNVTFSAFLGSSEYPNNSFNAEALRLGGVNGVVFAKRLLVDPANFIYNFTVTTPTVTPSAGSIYTAGASTFLVISYSSNVLYTRRTSGGDPQTTGSLAKTSGAGDTSINYSSFAKTSSTYAKPSLTAVTFDHEFSFARA